MMNPLFNLLSNGNMNNTGMNMMPVNNPMSNIMNLMNQFNQFKNNFKGNPEQQVRQLLNSGQMTQSQFNQLSQMANMFSKMFN